jgi:hypothetical protein
MGIIIKADYAVVLTRPKQGTHYSLEELKSFIGGGYIELVAMRDGWLVVDEDGRRKELPYNHHATVLYRHWINTQDYIVGDAFLCKKQEID